MDSTKNKKTVFLALGFAVIAVIGAVLQIKYPHSGYGGHIEEVVRAYVFPVMVVCGTVCLLLVAEMFCGLKILVGRGVKIGLLILLCTSAAAYFTIVSTQLTGLIPAWICELTFLNINVFLALINNVAAYRGVFLAQLFGVLLYVLVSDGQGAGERRLNRFYAKRIW